MTTDGVAGAAGSPPVDGGNVNTTHNGSENKNNNDDEAMPPPTKAAVRETSSVSFVSPSGVPFPWKLHETLEYSEANDLTNIISYVPARNGFKIHNATAFANELMPLFFGSIKMKSFQRQLNMWGFERVCNGPDRGAYLHTYFLKGQPDLCHNMKRIKVKGTGHSHSSHSYNASHGNHPRSVSPVRSNSAAAAATASGNYQQQHHHDQNNDHMMYHQFYGPSADPVTAAANAWTSSGDVHPTPLTSVVSQSDPLEPLDLSKSNQPFSTDLTAELESIKNRLDAALSKASVQYKENSLNYKTADVPMSSPSAASVLSEGDCIFFEGRNFFFVGDEGRRRQWMNGRKSLRSTLPRNQQKQKGHQEQQYPPPPPPPPVLGSPPRRDNVSQRRISKRFSLTPLNGNDSQNFVLKELMDMQFEMDDIDDDHSHPIDSSKSGKDITPIALNGAGGGGRAENLGGQNLSLRQDIPVEGVSSSIRFPQQQQGRATDAARRLSKRYSLEPNPAFASIGSGDGGAEQIPSHILTELLDLDLEHNDDVEGSPEHQQQQQQQQPQLSAAGLPETEEAPPMIHQTEEPQAQEDPIMIDLPPTSSGTRFSILSTTLDLDAAIMSSLGSLQLGDLDL